MPRMTPKQWVSYLSGVTEAPEIIKPRLLVEGGILGVAGEPGVGKSHLMQAMAFELASGNRTVGGLYPVTKPYRVLYLETEVKTTFNARLFNNPEWIKEYDEYADNIMYDNESVPNLNTTGGLDLLMSLVDDWRADICIIDSLTRVIEDERELTDQKQVFRNLRAICRDSIVNTSFIIILQLNKRNVNYNAKNNSYQEPPLRFDDIRGSKIAEYDLDTCMGVTRGISSERRIGWLKHRYSPIEFNTIEPITFGWKGHETIPYDPECMARPILRTLDNLGGECTYQDLESTLNIGSRHTTLRYVDFLVNHGLVALDTHPSPDGGRPMIYVKDRWK